MISLRRFYISILCTLNMVPTCLPAISNTLPLKFPKEDFQFSSESLKKGDELFEAALYPQAIETYKKLIEELSKPANNEDINLLMLARFHLAAAYFSLENYQNALAELDKNTLADPEKLPAAATQTRLHSLYLTSLTLKNLKNHNEAKKHLLTYANSTPIPAFHEEALFEIGLIDFLQKDYSEASKAFERLATQNTKPRLSTLSKLYLARTLQKQKKYAAAAEILAPLNSNLAKDDPLLFELNYLQGETAFEQKDYNKAITYFEKALPSEHPEKQEWYADTLYHLGWSYLKIGEETPKDPTRQNLSLKKAEEIFNQLIAIAPEENTCLALAQCYLSRTKLDNLPEYQHKAEKLLSRPNIYNSSEAKAHALLLRAEAAPSYAARDQFYRELTEANDPGINYAKGWYMRGLNDFEHGQTLLQTQSTHASQHAFKRAASAFRTAFDLLKDNDKEQAATALKYQALATSHFGEDQTDVNAFQILEELIHNPPIWEAVQNKDEIFYLHGYFAGRISENTDQKKYLETARQSLQAASSLPDNTFGDQALSYLGSLYYKYKDYKNAETTYLQLAQTFPTSPLAGQAWLWSACCADNLQENPKAGKERRQYIYENYPGTPAAAESFFTYYTYPEYLQGDRATIKHLQAFADNYTDSPFLMDANYLIGLDYKRDRKATGGKWIRKKSLTDAIDSFQKSEALFDEYYEKNLIPDDKLDYYTAMRYRATLERAMINLAIADEAQGAKKQIYLDYAEEVFKNLVGELKSKKNPYIQRLFQKSTYPLIEEESSFWLAQTYIKAGKDKEAENILAEMTDRYKKGGTTKGYYLARTLDEQGRLAMRKQDYQSALQLFDQAEEAAKGNVLSTDQKLDLWIQQSLAYRGLNQFDDSLLILSKVVNDDAISALRVKAMYLRAETYELQKRPELARKQLESMVKKGGIWAKKAQEKLDNAYNNNHLKDDSNHGH